MQMKYANKNLYGVQKNNQYSEGSFGNVKKT